VKPRWGEYAILALIALGVGALVAAAVPGPSYTDAYYYFNAGRRLATGYGLTDPYVALTYLGAPESLPAPSHTYWMPLTSLIVALAGGSFRGAQVVLVTMWVGLALLAFQLGAIFGGARRYAWTAGLLALACGYYLPFLVMTDTFTPFGLFGALCLLAVGWGRARGDWRGFALGGALAALAHLTRADGVLLIGVLALAALWSRGKELNHQNARNAGTSSRFSKSWRLALAGGAAYLLVMLPWFVRNGIAVGAPLPTGGAATIWLRGYNEIAAYPPDITAANFFAWGWGNILHSRWEALTGGLGTFVAVEGWVALSPLIVIALWKRRRDPRLLPVWLYALALHFAMTILFAYPGYRGGLFHSATALLPWWAALGVLGLDDAVDWVAARRRRWRAATAKQVFTVGIVALAIGLTLSTGMTRLQNQGGPAPLIRVAMTLPEDAVVMSNDPAAVYYYTGLAGVVVPDAGPEAVRAIAAQYGVTHLLLDENRTLPLNDLYEGRDTPPFLRAVEQDVAASVRVFEVVWEDGS